MDILYLLDRLENLIASSRRMPLMNQIIVKEADILSIIDEMRMAIPDEVQQSRRIVQDKERILAQANAEATNITSRARAESERAINREGLLRAAESRSQELIRQAEEKAREVLQESQRQAEHLQNDADTYVSETLIGLKEHLTSIETEVSRTILSIDRGLESIAMQNADDDSDEHDVTELATYEYIGDAHSAPVSSEARNEHDTRNPQIAPGAHSVDALQKQQEPMQPRRASLANDTIGGPPFN